MAPCAECEKALKLTDKRPSILARISPAQRDFLAYCRERLPWGKATIIIQEGEPKAADIEKETAVFGLTP